MESAMVQEYLNGWAENMKVLGKWVNNMVME